MAGNAFHCDDLVDVVQCDIICGSCVCPVSSGFLHSHFSAGSFPVEGEFALSLMSLDSRQIKVVAAAGKNARSYVAKAKLTVSALDVVGMPLLSFLEQKMRGWG